MKTSNKILSSFSTFTSSFHLGIAFFLLFSFIHFNTSAQGLQDRKQASQKNNSSIQAELSKRIGTSRTMDSAKTEKKIKVSTGKTTSKIGKKTTSSSSRSPKKGKSAIPGRSPSKSSSNINPPPPSPPNAIFHSIWVEHNVEYFSDERGIKINIRLEAQNIYGAFQVIANFQTKSGGSLYDRNGRYQHKGKVAIVKNYSQNGNHHWNDIALFIPYSELHLIGNHALNTTVKLYYGGQSYGQSQTYNFDFSATQYDAISSKNIKGQVTAVLANCNCNCKEYGIQIVSERGIENWGKLSSNCTFVSKKLADGRYTIKVFPPNDPNYDPSQGEFDAITISRPNVTIRNGRSERVAFSIIN